MSRFAKKPIQIPSNIEVSADKQILSVKGPLGTLTRPIHSSITITVNSDGVSITANNNSKLSNALTGTFAAHVKNMITGVVTPFKKALILEGIGYKVELKDKKLIFAVGFSHLVSLAIPENVNVIIEKNTIRAESIDLEKVGQFAASARAIKPPEPYLGKGIRYENEVVRRKQGKRSV